MHHADKSTSIRQFKRIILSVKAYGSEMLFVEMMGKFLREDNGWDDICLQRYLAACSLLYTLDDGRSYRAPCDVRADEKYSSWYVIMVACVMMKVFMHGARCSSVAGIVSW